VRRHGRSRAFAANQSSNAATSFAAVAPERRFGAPRRRKFLVFGFEFKNLPNREIHEIRERLNEEKLSREEREGGEDNFNNLSLDDSTN
jgi:hypothetical protein